MLMGVDVVRPVSCPDSRWGFQVIMTWEMDNPSNCARDLLAATLLDSASDCHSHSILHSIKLGSTAHVAERLLSCGQLSLDYN